MTSDAVVKSVGKKLRYYFEVKRLEDGFDLSGVGQPTLDHPRLKPRKTLQCDVQPDVPLKYHFKSPSIRVKLTQFPGYKAPTSSRERRVKKILENYVTKSEFMMPYMSNYSYVNTSKGRKMRSDASCVLKSGKKRPIKGSYPVLRSVHPHFVTKKQADRMVTVASKLLVASETVQDIKPKHQGHSPHDRQAAPSPFETERQLPHIEPQSRPKTSRGFHGKWHSEDGRDSAYTTDRASPGSEEYQRRDGQGRLLSPHSSDSDADRSPHPPLNGRPQGRRRPPSARTRRQMQVSDISHPAGGQVGVELAVQTRDSVGSQTDNRGGLDERMVRSGPPVDYVIYVRTGKRIGASTKADVKITLYGELGRSQEFLLAESRRHKIKFQKGHEDLFTLHSPHVGRLKCVKIGHDRPELMFAWFLEGVTVEDRMDRRVYECPCERWLSGQDGDKQTYRILPVDRDRALLDDSEDDNSSDVSYIKKYGQETGSEGDRSPRNSPESVRARRSQKTSHISESETETETESDSETASSEASPREVAMKPPLTDKKAAQTHQYKPTQANRAEEKPEVSPGRKMKDDFFDQRPAGPVYTFRPATSVSSQEDVHKPELSDSDTATSRTYTSDNTESNSAAVIPPRAAYPVIAEEKVLQQETVKVARPRPESRQSNSTTNMPKKSVPLIAVQESAEPPIDSTPANSASQVHFSTSESVTENSSVLIGVSNIDSKAEPSSLLAVATSGPKIDRTRSGSSTDRSGSTTDRSGSTTDRSGSGTDRTGSGTDRTGSGTDRTEPGTNRNASGTDQTGSGTDRTGSGTDRTGSGTDRTGSSTDRTVSGSGTTVDRTVSDKVTESSTKTIEPSPVSKPEQVSSGMSNRQVVDLYEQQTERRSSYSDSGSSTADSDSESSGTSDSESDSETDATTPRSQKDTLEMTREAYKAELGGESIHQAAKTGNLTKVKEIVQNSAESISSVNEVGWTPLHIAASEGQLDVVRWLVSAGVSLNTDTPTGYTALHLAALHGHLNTIMELSSLGAAVNCRTTDRQTPLHLAARSGDISCVKWLVGNRASVAVRDESGRTPRDLAEENEHDDVAHFLRQCEQDGVTEVNSSYSRIGVSSVPSSAEKIETSVLEKTSSVQASVTVQEEESEAIVTGSVESPTQHRHQSIHDAAKRGNLPRVEEIVREHPDKKNSVNEVGWTPLHIAAAEGRLDVVKWLVSSEVDLNTETPTGYTAMHLAALHGHAHNLKMLASRGATVDCITTDGQTPLHLASMNGDLSCVKWLVGNRASVLSRDEARRTPRDLAEENEHDDVADFLRQCEQDTGVKLTGSDDQNGGYELPPIEEDVVTRDMNFSANPKVTTDDAGSEDSERPVTPGRSQEDLQEKRQLYSEQQTKKEESGLSFLDMIRQEMDNGS